MRTRVYVDGFNLYYGALKGTPFKWLDLVKLAYQLLPVGYSVTKLKYFTARVSGIPDAGAPARQQALPESACDLARGPSPFGDVSLQNDLASLDQPSGRGSTY